MSCPGGVQINEYVCVVRLANHYVAVYRREKSIECISKNPEIDIRVAEVAAKKYAETNNIFWSNTLFQLDQPIVTVLKLDGKLIPAELHPDKIITLINNNHTDGAKAAFITAFVRNLLYVPQYGMWLSEQSWFSHD